MNILHRILPLFLALCLTAFAPAFAKDAPDAWVKGLWLKATGLPAGAHLEDMSTENVEEPYFIYSVGKGGDGPAITIAVGRYPQNTLAEKLANLDKKALAEFVGSEDFKANPPKDLKFTEAPKLSAKLTYPCQIATYTNSRMGLNHAILFIQTDEYMFSVSVNRSTKDKKYGEADVEKWLMNLKMVEQ
jgi:hypothetical protein